MDPLEQAIEELKKELGEDVITTGSTAPRPEKAIIREAFDDFNERNPLAGGGMLVETGFGGTRQGYKGKNLDRAAYKEIRPITQANIDNYAFFTSKEAAKPYKYKVQLPGGTEVFKTRKEAQAAIDAAPITNRDYTEGLIDFKIPKGATNYDKGRIKIPTGEFIGEGRDKSQIFKIQNKDGSNVKYMASGTGEGKKFYNSIEEIKKAKLKSLPDELVKVSSKIIKEGISEVTYKNKKTGKIVKYYKPRVGESKETIPDKGTTSLKKAEKFIKDYYVRNPKPVRDPQKSYATKDRRNVALQETDTTKATGTKKYNYHHIRQIAGGVPLTSDDVAIINQRINSKIGGKFNETLNRISAAIQKNNRLALEAMNAKEEGLALEYMKRSDDLNAQAEKIVNSAIDKLPKKYKGYVGFNQFTLPRDEYGLPISNEPMLIRKVGGMPVSKDAIDLTTLNRKDAATFRKIVKQQAERGKIGKIDISEILNNIQSYSKLKQCKIPAADGGRIGFANSVECITDGLNEMKKSAAGGDKKAARQLIDTAKNAATGGRLIKNVLGPGAILGEAIFEGALIGNKVLGGKPLKQAWAESFLSYLDPRKYRGELDPLLLERDRMLEQSGYKDVLRSGFAAQDQLSAANEAVEKRNIASARNRLDQYLPAAADAREQAARAGLSTKIISDEAFKDAVNLAQESIQGLEGNQRFKYGIASTPQGEGADSMRRQKAETAMKNLYTQYTDQELRICWDKINLTFCQTKELQKELFHPSQQPQADWII